jgi:hypothetical protein
LAFLIELEAAATHLTCTWPAADRFRIDIVGKAWLTRFIGIAALVRVGRLRAAAQLIGRASGIPQRLDRYIVNL